MSENTRQKAQAALAEIEEVTAVALREPVDAGAVVPLEKGPEDDQFF